jgi:hypothetical protein
VNEVNEYRLSIRIVAKRCMRKELAAIAISRQHLNDGACNPCIARRLHVLGTIIYIMIESRLSPVAVANASYVKH